MKQHYNLEVSKSKKINTMSMKYQEQLIDIKGIYEASNQEFSGHKHKKSEDVISILSSRGKIKLKLIPFQ